MKLKCLRPCWIRNETRGVMVPIQKDQLVEMDETKEAETIFSLLTGGKLTVVDERFIPKEARYIVLSYINYTSKDGFPRSDGPGAEVTLSAEVATPLLIAGLIKPSDPKQWTVKRLLRGDTVKSGEVKRMFDPPDAPAPKENWIFKRREK